MVGCWYRWAMNQTVSVSQHVEAPPELVWSLVSDITRMGEWSPESTGGRWTGGATGPKPGARFRGDNRNGSKRWSTTGTVVDAVPGQAFSFRVSVAGLKIALWSYRLEPTDGGCRITETWTDERGVLARSLGKPVSGVADRVAHNRAGMEETLKRLAATAAEAD